MMFDLHRDPQQFCFEVRIIGRHPLLIIVGYPASLVFELFRLSWGSSKGFEI